MKQTTLLKFSASWCGPCKMMKQRLENFTACPIKEIDIDDEGSDDAELSKETGELIEKYHVMNIPLMVLIDENDNVLHKWVGLTDVKEIEKAVACA